MYLLQGPYDTTMLAPRYPQGYKGGYVYAGNYRLMHKLCITAKKVILRPNGVLAFPENYSLAMAKYDRYSNKVEVPSNLPILVEEQRLFTQEELIKLRDRVKRLKEKNERFRNER